VGKGKSSAGLAAKPGADTVVPAAKAPLPPMGPSKFTRSDDDASLVEVTVDDRVPPVKVPIGGVDMETARQLVPLPRPPRGVPVLPEGVPTPSVLDELPVMPKADVPEPKAAEPPPQPKPVVPTVPEASAKPAPGRGRK
jgi:hypothetical protein